MDTKDDSTSRASHSPVKSKGKGRAQEETQHAAAHAKSEESGAPAAGEVGDGAAKVLPLPSIVPSSSSADPSNAATSSPVPAASRSVTGLESAGALLASTFADCTSPRIARGDLTAANAPGLVRMFLNPHCAAHFRRFALETSASLAMPVLALGVHHFREWLRDNPSQLGPNQLPTPSQSFAAVA